MLRGDTARRRIAFVIIVGVDAGGSKTRAVAWKDGEAVGQALGGAGAVRPGRALAAAGVIAEQARRVLANAGVLRAETLVVGAAGVGPRGRAPRTGPGASGRGGGRAGRRRHRRRAGRGGRLRRWAGHRAQCGHRQHRRGPRRGRRIVPAGRLRLADERRGQRLRHRAARARRRGSCPRWPGTGDFAHDRAAASAAVRGAR